MEFLTAQLDNGLNIVAEVNPSAASMAAGFFVKTGSRDETPEISGASHFLEHMMFKGTARRSAFDVNRDFDRMGANYNAFTSEENTVYYGAVLPEFQTQLLDLLCDILRPALRSDDFDMEKNVILDEIALYKDQPRFRVYDNMMKKFFTPHPLGNSILGTDQSITDLPIDQMKAYFEQRYSPGNISVIGVGNLDFDAFVTQVGELCSHWEPFEVSRQTPQAESNAATHVLADGKVAREHIGLMSMGPSRQSEDIYAAELLATVLGDVNGSRLFYALVDPAIADEASMGFAPMDHAGAFLTFISADAERAAKALEIAQTEIQRFVDDGPEEDEIAPAKNKIASGATLKGELPMGRLAAVGFDWVYRGDYTPLAEQIDKLFVVTGDQIHELARSYDLNKATVIALGPLESI